MRGLKRSSATLKLFLNLQIDLRKNLLTKYFTKNIRPRLSQISDLAAPEPPPRGGRFTPTPRSGRGPFQSDVAPKPLHTPGAPPVATSIDPPDQLPGFARTGANPLGPGASLSKPHNPIPLHPRPNPRGLCVRHFEQSPGLFNPAAPDRASPPHGAGASHQPLGPGAALPIRRSA